MAKNSESYGLTANFSGVETHEGQWISKSEHGLTFKYRKPGSSTMVKRFIAADDIVACIGKVGGEATLFVKSNHIPVFRSGKRGKEKPLQVTGMVPLGVLLSTQSEEYKDIVVHRNCAAFIEEEKDDSAPKRGRKAAGESTEKKEKKPKKEKSTKG